MGRVGPGFAGVKPNTVAGGNATHIKLARQRDVKAQRRGKIPRGWRGVIPIHTSRAACRRRQIIAGARVRQCPIGKPEAKVWPHHAGTRKQAEGIGLNAGPGSGARRANPAQDELRARGLLENQRRQSAAPRFIVVELKRFGGTGNAAHLVVQINLACRTVVVNTIL